MLPFYSLSLFSGSVGGYPIPAMGDVGEQVAAAVAAKEADKEKKRRRRQSRRQKQNLVVLPGCLLFSRVLN